MFARQTKKTVPLISLRVPGPWQGPSELAGRLPAGFRIEGEEYVMSSGMRLAFEVMPADGQFPAIFRTACRRPPTNPYELRGLDNYGMSAALTGPGGSLAAAQNMLHAGAGVIRAGGFGVFIDSSLIAHTGSDWLELAEHRHELDAVFYAFVSFVKSHEQVFSHGMHTLGQRDGTVRHRGDPKSVYESLDEFLHRVCAGRLPPRQSDRFADRHGRRYRLHTEPDRSPYPNHPINNPYGRWHLEPLE